MTTQCFMELVPVDRFFAQIVYFSSLSYLIVGQTLIAKKRSKIGMFLTILQDVVVLTEKTRTI